MLSEKPTAVSRRRVANPAPHADNPVLESPAQQVPTAEHHAKVAAPPPEEHGWQPPDLGPWGKVVENTFKLDVEATFRRLRSDLVLPDPTQYALVKAALNDVDQRAFEATMLVRAAKMEQHRVDYECDKRMEVLRKQAQSQLLKLKEETKGMRAPTLDDIRDEMVRCWPDEVWRIESRKEESHAARGLAEGLEASWRSRSSSLKAMMNSFASR